MKRFFDICCAVIGLIIFSPVLIICMILVWFQDFHSPLYIARRVGKNGKIFRMVKIRSMVVRAEKSGVHSTAADDARITNTGRMIRKYKLDELPQLWNVLCGDMSLVGPRPNVQSDVNLYTGAEVKLLDIRPGITDFSSIVFSDEGAILEDAEDPDLLYNQIIRPWKSRLGLVYVENNSLLIDLEIIVLTLLGSVSRQKALLGIVMILKKIGVKKELIQVASREKSLQPFPPPGANSVFSRGVPLGAKGCFFQGM